MRLGSISGDSPNNNNTKKKKNWEAQSETRIIQLEARIHELIVANNDLNKLSSGLNSDILKYHEIEHAANEEIEVLIDKIMRLHDLHDVVSDLEDKISTFSKNESLCQVNDMKKREKNIIYKHSMQQQKLNYYQVPS